MPLLEVLRRTRRRRWRSRVHMVANSLGCQIAVEVAIRLPDLVESLVLVGPTADPSAPTLLRQLSRLVLESRASRRHSTGSPERTISATARCGRSAAPG